jgi:hypothetical protein
MAGAGGRRRRRVDVVASALALCAVVVVGACSGGSDDGGGGGSEVSAGASGGDDGPVKDDGKRRQLAAGNDGGAPTPGEIVGTSADDFASKWTASGATASAPDVGDVDFTSEVVVAIFAGERPSGGWRIGPDVDVKIQGRFGAVIYEILGPGDGCTSTQALTHPYLVLAVKAGNVRFESSERMVPCE